MNNNNKYSYINQNGKKVSGSAAFLKYVFTDMGGIENYEKQIALDNFINYLNSPHYSRNDMKNPSNDIITSSDLW
ncbi:MAG: hypothetical protein KIB00_09565 [Paeniclostridium sordellii]|nr:hypothetical protein [Paeniclostridium sordellii]